MACSRNISKACSRIIYKYDGTNTSKLRGNACRLDAFVQKRFSTVSIGVENGLFMHLPIVPSNAGEFNMWFMSNLFDGEGSQMDLMVVECIE